MTKESTEHYTRDGSYMYGYDAGNFGMWYAVPTVASAFTETFAREVRYFETRKAMRNFLRRSAN